MILPITFSNTFDVDIDFDNFDDFYHDTSSLDYINETTDITTSEKYTSGIVDIYFGRFRSFSSPTYNIDGYVNNTNYFNVNKQLNFFNGVRQQRNIEILYFNNDFGIDDNVIINVTANSSSSTGSRVDIMFVNTTGGCEVLLRQGSASWASTQDYFNNHLCFGDTYSIVDYGSGLFSTGNLENKGYKFTSNYTNLKTMYLYVENVEIGGRNTYLDNILFSNLINLTVINHLPYGEVTVENQNLCYNFTHNLAEVKLNYNITDREGDELYYGYSSTNVASQTLFYDEDFILDFNECQNDFSVMDSSILITNNSLASNYFYNVLYWLDSGVNDRLYLTTNNQDNEDCRGMLNFNSQIQPVVYSLPNVYEENIDLSTFWEFDEDYEMFVAILDTDNVFLFNYTINKTKDSLLKFYINGDLLYQNNDEDFDISFFINTSSKDINWSLIHNLSVKGNFSINEIDNIKSVYIEPQTKSLWEQTSKASLDRIIVNGKKYLETIDFSTTRNDSIYITDRFSSRRKISIYVTDVINNPNSINFTYDLYIDGSTDFCSFSVDNEYKGNFLSKTYGGLFGGLIQNLDLQDTMEQVFWTAYFLMFFILYFTLRDATITFQTNNILFFIFGFLGIGTFSQFISVGILTLLSFVPVIAEVFNIQ